MASFLHCPPSPGTLLSALTPLAVFRSPLSQLLLPNNLTCLLLEMTAVTTAPRVPCCHLKKLHDAVVKSAHSLAFVLGSNWHETTQMTLIPSLFLTRTVISV